MPNLVPNHIGYIVDGNRRWARQHGLPVYEGHLAGYNAIRDVLIPTFEAGVKYVSAYTFSTENWKRGQQEVGNIMRLMVRMLTADISIFQQNNIKLVVAGTREGLTDTVIRAIENGERETKDNTGGTFMLCFNYGGQMEIAQACKKIVQSGIHIDEITPQLITENLYYPEVPPVDLIVRTSGEQRISNFMLWRAAYSELFFLEKLWPDMTKDDVGAILKEYSRRSRRIGG